jgi:hypothetical protein
MKRMLLATLLLFLISLLSFAQERSANALFGSTGLSISDGTVIGVTLAGGIGYQRTMGRPWLRMVPSLNFASYTNRLTQDVPDAFQNSISLKVNLNADVFTVGSFSVLAGVGLSGNRISGLIGTGGDPGRQRSDYFRRGQLAANGLVGFRLIPPTSRFGYELLVVNASVGGEGYGTEVGVLQFRLLYDLR